MLLPLQATAAEAGRRKKGEYLRGVKLQMEEDGGEWLCLDPCEDTAMDLPRAKVRVLPCHAPFSHLSLSLYIYALLFSLSTLPCPCPASASVYNAMQSQGRGASGMDAYYNAEYGRRSLWVAMVRACVRACVQRAILSTAEPPSLGVPNAPTGCVNVTLRF